jgi:dTMP kinase
VSDTDRQSTDAIDSPHEYPGALVVVEGIDGSGKSTQLYLLRRWLEASKYKIHFTEWNSSPLVKSATSRGKNEKMLTPTTFSMIHAADFADRCERQIIPLLSAGYLVLADRYLYTAIARDGARGMPTDWVRNLYSFAPIPDVAFYFRAPLEVSLKRILAGRSDLKYHEAGMDMGFSIDPVESFRLFQGRIQKQYDSMVDTDDFVEMDATQPVADQQEQARAVVESHLDLSRFKID